MQAKPIIWNIPILELNNFIIREDDDIIVFLGLITERYKLKKVFHNFNNKIIMGKQITCRAKRNP